MSALTRRFGRVLLGQVNRQPLGEVADRRLARRVGGDAGERARRVHRRDVEDHPLLPLGHRTREHLRRQDRPEQVQGGHPLQRLDRQVEEALVGVGGRLRIVAARAVDQEVDGAALAEHAAWPPPRARGGRARRRAGPGAGPFPPSRTSPITCSARSTLRASSDHVRVAGGERPRHLAAEHAGAAGDDRRLPGEVVERADVVETGRSAAILRPPRRARRARARRPFRR